MEQHLPTRPVEEILTETATLIISWWDKSHRTVFVWQTFQPLKEIDVLALRLLEVSTWSNWEVLWDKLQHPWRGSQTHKCSSQNADFGQESTPFFLGGAVNLKPQNPLWGVATDFSWETPKQQCHGEEGLPLSLNSEDPPLASASRKFLLRNIYENIYKSFGMLHKKGKLHNKHSNNHGCECALEQAKPVSVEHFQKRNVFEERRKRTSHPDRQIRNRTNDETNPLPVLPGCTDLLLWLQQPSRRCGNKSKTEHGGKWSDWGTGDSFACVAHQRNESTCSATRRHLGDCDHIRELPLWGSLPKHQRLVERRNQRQEMRQEHGGHPRSCRWRLGWGQRRCCSSDPPGSSRHARWRNGRSNSRWKICQLPIRRADQEAFWSSQERCPGERLHLPGVHHEANNHDINKAYRKLARQYHPDKGGSQEKFFELQASIGIIKAARELN